MDGWCSVVEGTIGKKDPPFDLRQQARRRRHRWFRALQLGQGRWALLRPTEEVSVSYGLVP